MDSASQEDVADGLSCSANSYEARVPGDEEDDSASSSTSSTSSDGSPLGWPLGRRERSHSGFSFASTKSATSSSNAPSFAWEEKREKQAPSNTSEIEMMKERFAKLLLGEDMSGGAKGVSSSLAISNAITNLAASVFGELWRLEPLSNERKSMWKREMEWLLSVSDYIVELVPSWQSFRDGSNLEVMVTRPRSDIHINLPALRKLDAMLLESLESFKDTEFWYVEQGIVVAEKDDMNSSNKKQQRQEEKWWLPTPRVPANGLSEESRKGLQNQRDCTSQILKAAVAINSQVLSEMEVPESFWEALPKNGKSCLGELLYRGLTAERFSPEAILQQFDLSSEHSALETANRIEAAIHAWQRKAQQQPRETKLSSKSSWGKVKDLVSEIDRCTLVERAESLLLSVKQKFPGLPQSVLDMNKIQFNRDVGQSILESYSRVLESLAFSILARIDDVLFIDDSTKEGRAAAAAAAAALPVMRRGRVSGQFHIRTPFATPLVSPNCSPPPAPVDSPRKTNSPAAGYKQRSYARSLESSRKLVSPPGRD